MRTTTLQRQINQRHKDKIIVNHEFKGIFILHMDSGYNEILKVTNKASIGKGSSLVTFKKEVLYFSSNGAFKFNVNKQDFFKDSILSNKFFSNNDNVIGRIILNEKTDKLWGFSNNNIIYVAPGKFENSLQSIKISVPNFFRKSLGLQTFESVTYLIDEKYLIGTSSGYAILDLDKLDSKEYFVKINSISKEFLNAKNEAVSLLKNNKFKSKENNINVAFSVPEFDKYTEVKYQYQLEGLSNEWSNWFNGPQISLNNLPHGEYTFKVRALVGNKLSKNVASYSFSIDKPWYISNSMIAVYILLFLGILYTNYIIYKRHYNKKKDKLLERKQREYKVTQLENEKVIMRLKNESLRNEVENKNRELTISTMSIIKKNEVLNNIKKELLEQNSDEACKHVVKAINKNINNKKDWEFIEEAFNNADKDFMKKIKKLHADLTPNDLRFCAYLRLNLSSKEIAPLLNISYRSVEIKRYRLRKKMNLPHEKSLVEYILEV